MIRKYILVDDDPINNSLNRVIIKNAIAEADIKSFTAPEDGLAFIKNEYNNISEPIILFLDINMPTLNGWEFIEQYEKFSPEIKNQISIYILSSSVNPDDKNKAEANLLIRGLISKPLNRGIILSVADDLTDFLNT